MTDVLLVKPHCEHSVLPPLSLGYLASSLGRRGFSSRIIHCSKERMGVSDVKNLISEEGIRVVGVSCCSNDHPWLVSLASELDSEPRVHLVAGGAHATGLSQRLMGMIPRIDFLVRSEGETALPKLVAALLNGTVNDSVFSGIPNLVWRDSSGAVVENPIELHANLDALGFPDWDQMPPSEYAGFMPHGGSAKASPVGQLITTRGCPYGCNYCAAGLMHGRRIRKRSPESIVEEIEYLMKAHGVKEIHIEDDNFTFSKDHVVNVCTAIRRKGIRMYFSLPNGVRLDRLDDEILRELQATGFYTFSIGIESGSQLTLKRMSKALDLNEVENRIAHIRKYDFQLKGYFMIGYPGETKDDIEQTIQYARSLDLDRAYFTMFIPLPGTREFQRLEQEGKIDIAEFDWGSFYTKGRTNPPYIPEGMTADELEEYAHLAYRLFYLRPGILMKMLRELRITSFSHFLQVVWNLANRNLSYFI